ncbi:phosphotransferase [Bacillus sp. Bva_UNVM-123]|uniref:aminoglycoside phosphotransferase family protein n=1 Tax=Bacillus sp. Bva_UNVM-123 TaxID=2829798 RepID=UPI00391F2005
MNMIKTLRQSIPFLQNAIEIEIIHKGFSSDVKYVVYFKQGEKYLLRTADLNLFSRKAEEFHLLSTLHKMQVNSPKPIKIGEVAELEKCYYLLSYIEGEDARDLLPFYRNIVQYEIGLEAGADLKKINSIHAPISIGPWYERKMKKYKAYLETYKTCGIKIKEDHKLIAFIDKHVHYLKERPSQFLHDDFHVGNLIVKDEKYAGVIDFNRFDWGDPYFEFIKVGLFSREVSIPFSVGQIQGYFNDNIPNDFWQLYSVYLAMELLSAVVWTKKVVPEKLTDMFERIEMILEDHKGFELIIPTWYSEYNKESDIEISN